jgi:hypothetical protein
MAGYIGPDGKELSFDEISNIPAEKPWYENAFAPKPTAPTADQNAMAMAKAYGVYSQVDPDQEARDREALSILGTPQYSTANIAPEIRKEALRRAEAEKNAPKDWDKFVQDNPATAKYLSDPNYMSVSHDDMQTLAKVEGTVNAFTNADKISRLREERGKIGELMWQSGQRVEDLDSDTRARLVRINNEMGTLGEKLPKSSWSLEGIASGIGGMGAAARKALKLGTAAGVAGAVVTAPTGGLGAIPAFGYGATFGFAKEFGQEAWGNSYLDMINHVDTTGRTMNTEAAQVGSMLIGTSTAILGSVQFGKLIEKIPGGQGILGIFEKSVPEEILANPTTASAAWRNFIANYFKSVTEQSLVVGTIEAANIAGERTAEVLSGQTFNHANDPSAIDRITQATWNMVPVAATLSLPGNAMGLRKDLKQKTIGDTQQQALTDLAQGLQDSKTLERLPGAMKNFIAEATKGGPTETVYIPAKEFVEYFQKADPEAAVQIAEKLGVAPEQLQEALNTGGNIKLSLADVASTLGRTEHFKNLIQDMKFNEGDLTPREQAEFAKQYKENLKKTAEKQQSGESANTEQHVSMSDELGLSEAADRTKAEREKALADREKAENEPAFQERLTKAAEEERKAIEDAIKDEPLYKASDMLGINLQLFGKVKDVKELAQKYIKGKLNDEQRARFELISDEHNYSSGDHLAKEIIGRKVKGEEINSRLAQFAEQYKTDQLGDKNDIAEQTEHNDGKVHATAMEAEALRGMARGEHTVASRKKQETEINKRWKDAEQKLANQIADGRNSEKIRQLKEQLADLKRQHKEELAQLKKEADYNTRWKDAENKAESDKQQAQQKHDAQLAKEWLKAENVSQRIARQAQIGIKAALEYARETSANKSVKDAVNWRQYLHQARGAARSAEKAYRAGKYEEAAQYKDQEMLNHALGIEAVKAEKEVRQARAFFKRIDKAKPGKMAVGDKYQVDKLLSRFGLTKRKPDPGAVPEDRITLAQWLDEKQNIGWPIDVSDNIRDETLVSDYKELVMDDFRDLKESVSQVYEVSVKAKKHLRESRKESIDESIADMRSSAVKSVGDKHPFTSDPNANKSTLQKILAIPDTINAHLLKAETIASELDGFTKKMGTWAENMIFPFSEAYNKKVRMLEKATADVDNLLKTHYDKKELARFRKVDTFIDSLGFSLSREQMVSVLLNWGNKGNRQRLIDGKKWTEANVQEIFSKLTDKDFEFAQGVWDYLESYYPQMAELHQNTVGGILKKVEADPFTWNGQEYQGGYYPAVPDTTMSIDARINNRLAMGKYDEPGYRASSRAGSTKERAGKATYQVRLDLDVINQHLKEIIHDLTHREAIIDANRILYSPEIKQTLQETRGSQFWDTLEHYLKNVASEGWIKTTEIERAAAEQRSKISIATMAYKASVMIPQMLGYFQVGEMLGYHRAATSIYNFMRKIDKQNAYDFVHGKSAFMKDRINNFDRDGRIMLEKHFGDVSKLDEINKKGFWLMGQFDQVASIPTWIEAYKDGMKLYEGHEARAVEHADSIIRQTLGSGLPKDLARFMSGPEWQKWLTMFSSYTNAMYNLTYRRYKITTGAGEYTFAQRFSGAVAFAVFNLLAQPIFNELMAGRGGDDKKKGNKWMWSSIAKNTTSMVPIIGPIGNYTISKAMGEYSTYRSTPFDTVVESFEKAATNGIKMYEGKGKASDLVKSIANLAAYTMPYPQQFNIIAENAWNKTQGKKIEWYEIPYRQSSKR